MKKSNHKDAMKTIKRMQKSEKQELKDLKQLERHEKAGMKKGKKTYPRG